MSDSEFAPALPPLPPHIEVALETVRKAGLVAAADALGAELARERARKLPTYTADIEGAFEAIAEILTGSSETAGITHRAAELVAERDRLAAERDKLQAFKSWVHAYLDGKGVPHHPPGTHGAEGCRIGDRMDWVWADRDRLAAENAQLRTLLAGLADAAGPFALQAEIMDNGNDNPPPDRDAMKGYLGSPWPTIGDCRRLAAARDAARAELEGSK